VSTLSDVAQAVLLHGPPTRDKLARRDPIFRAAEIPWPTFRSAAEGIGSKQRDPRLSFFDATQPGKLAFGPGAGLVVGVSVGAENVRAVLVDANGWEYHPYESDHLPGQLAKEPPVVLNRIKVAVAEVLQKTFDQSPGLLVDGELPLLGCAVAWPTPVDRARKPAGHALAHSGWRSQQPLDRRVELALGIEGLRTYALNDTHAAALAIAHRETHQRDAVRWQHPQLTVVLRLAGNVGGAVIVIEPPTAPRDDTESQRKKSGCIGSILLGGVDNHAGEIGHAPIAPSTIDELNEKRPEGLERLTPQRCSCSWDDKTPNHLEAYASVLAVTQRVLPELERSAALDEIVTKVDTEPYAHALGDVGRLVGDALAGPVAVLNPAKIIVTGSLAVPAVCHEIKESIEGQHKFGTGASVSTIPESDNDYVRARGAAVAMIRNEVHRRLDELLGGTKDEVNRQLEELTIRLPANPL
jgi:predicted NBD/HSP70 family sugar kinase